MLLLCSPSNPTGTMYSPEELGELADVVLERDLTVDRRRDLRAAGLRQASLCQLRHGAPGLAGADHPGQRREQGLCHDRLANRLDAVAGERGHGHGRPAEPGDLEPVQHQPVRGAGGRGRSAGMRRSRCWPSSPSGASSSRQRVASLGLTCPEMAGAFYAFINIKPHLGRNVRRHACRQLHAVVPDAAGTAERGHGDGLGFRRRRLRSHLVRHGSRHAQSRLRPHRGVLVKQVAGLRQANRCCSSTRHSLD